ncbi:MAG: hypothetical protein K6U14_09955 [Firmicutes bacterium]|nr:hypothetical protein [Alicyclobacillaceae bacterium]MCL6497937.1 hypothetical protein [Bacillota bacterium]
MDVHEAVEHWVDRYYEAAVEDPDPVAFVDRALGGEWGDAPQALLLRLLDQVEAIVLANIADRQEEVPGQESEAEMAAEYWRERFAAARTLVLERRRP